jgi:hypothetical protein
MTPEDTSRSADSRPGSVLWLVYGQVSAMLGAFSLLVLVSQFVEVGLNDVIRTAADYWAYQVRPLVGYPIQLLVDQLPAGARFDVAPAAKDYVAVGLVSSLAYVRALNVVGVRVSLWMLFPTCALLVVAWPLFAWFFARRAVSSGLAGSGRFWSFLAIWLAPLMYLSLLFAANSWLVSNP